MSSSSALQLLRSALPAVQSLATRAMSSSAVYTVGHSTNIKWHEGAVPTEAKEKLLNQRGCVVWFTGLSGSGKSTVACTLEHALAEQGKVTALLDGDNIRHGLNKNLGFSAEDRQENIRRIGEVSKLFSETGLITLVSFISPYRRDRDAVRARLPPGRFIEVFMKVGLAPAGSFLDSSRSLGLPRSCTQPATTMLSPCALSLCSACSLHAGSHRHLRAA